MLKTALAIRHVAFEDLGYFEAPLVEAGYAVRYIEAGVDDLSALDPRAFALVVVLGGPMAVYERDRYPFLTDELRIIDARLAAGQPVLGVCLGAQLIAHALGAKVYPGAGKEIGFAPVALTAAGAASPLGAISPGQPVLHWHGDTFDLPPDATLLASTERYANQAFAIGDHVLALQFHLEAGHGIERWLEGHAEELRSAHLRPDAIRRDGLRYAAAIRAVAETVLADWLRLDGER